MKKPTALLLLTGILMSSVSPFVSQTNANQTSLLSTPWNFSGNNSASELYQPLSGSSLVSSGKIQVTFDLHGTCFLGGDASALIIDQQGWKYVSLAEVGENCKDGSQTVEIPISSFKDIVSSSPLDLSKPIDGYIHARFWNSGPFSVTVSSIVAGNNSPTLPKPPVPSVSHNYVSGIIPFTVNADPKTTNRVVFYIDNVLKHTDSASPYLFEVDTRQLNDGKHVIKSVTRTKTGQRLSQSTTIDVKNSLIPTATPTPSPIPTATPAPTPSVSPTPRPTSTPTPSPTSIPTNTTKSWDLQSVDAMKDTKDAICGGQRNADWIGKFVNKAVELGATHVAISQPYDNPSCGSALAYTKEWVTGIRANGLKVWHRHMPMAFEGIYSVTKTRSSDDYLSMIKNYIIANASDFEEGDIFTPIPEPQNGGISGITYCAQNMCQFTSKEHFNKWLRDAMTVSKEAFTAIGKPSIKVGYYGFDGFVAWGANNPDWNGILEDDTVRAMGNITIDHYPELIGTDMSKDILELEARYPGVDIIIGEWGTVTGTNTEATALNFMNAVKRPSVKGFNYWQFGPHGAGEQLINDDFTNRVQFDEVQSFFKPK